MSQFSYRTYHRVYAIISYEIAADFYDNLTHFSIRVVIYVLLMSTEFHCYGTQHKQVIGLLLPEAVYCC